MALNCTAIFDPIRAPKEYVGAFADTPSAVTLGEILWQSREAVELPDPDSPGDIVCRKIVGRQVRNADTSNVEVHACNCDGTIIACKPTRDFFADSEANPPREDAGNVVMQSQRIAIPTVFCGIRLPQFIRCTFPCSLFGAPLVRVQDTWAGAPSFLVEYVRCLPGAFSQRAAHYRPVGVVNPLALMQIVSFPDFPAEQVAIQSVAAQNPATIETARAQDRIPFIGVLDAFIEGIDLEFTNTAGERMGVFAHFEAHPFSDEGYTSCSGFGHAVTYTAPTGQCETAC